MSDDPVMNRMVDLDEVAAVLASRVPGWRSAGLEVGQVTWRDAEASWPQPLETDRARVLDPDSVGVAISGPGGAELSVVLFRGGWADVDFIAGLDDAGCLPASDVASASDFEVRTDKWVARVSGGPQRRSVSAGPSRFSWQDGVRPGPGPGVLARTPPAT